MRSILPAPGPLTVYVDDACPMCVGAARIATRHDIAGRLRIANPAAADERFETGASLRALHVVDQAGTVFRGYDAVVAIVVSAPGRRRLLGPALSLRPVRWVGVRLYARVARNRRRADAPSGC